MQPPAVERRTKKCHAARAPKYQLNRRQKPRSRERETQTQGEKERKKNIGINTLFLRGSRIRARTRACTRKREKERTGGSVYISICFLKRREQRVLPNRAFRTRSLFPRRLLKIAASEMCARRLRGKEVGRKGGRGRKVFSVTESLFTGGAWIDWADEGRRVEEAVKGESF